MSCTGDLSIIQSDLIRERVKDFYSARLKTSIVKFSVESGSKQGDNFIGVVYRVSGEANEITNGEKTGYDEDNDKLRIILKVAPSNELRRQTFPVRQFFLREIYIYNEVCSILWIASAE